MKTCTVDGCSKNGRRRGLCTRHWRVAFPNEYKMHLADMRVRSTSNEHREHVRDYTKKRQSLPHVRAARTAAVARYHDKPDSRWVTHNRTARKRGIATALTREQFDHLTNQPCAYCGEMSPGKSFVGIDRLDSKRGYTDENCVPCCMVCNQMKMGRTMGDFLAKARQIVSRSSSVVAAVGVLIVLLLAGCGLSLSSDTHGVCGTDAAIDAGPALRSLTLIEGQSNGVGQGSTTEVDPIWALPFPSVRELTRTVRSPDNPPPIGYTDAPLGPRVQRFGAELTLGRAMPDSDILICAGGAFSLAYQWNPDGNYPAGAVENWFHSCETWAHEQEVLLGGRVTNVLWFQGESDTKTLADATAYGDRLLDAGGRMLDDFPCANFFFYRLITPGNYVTTERAQQDRAAALDPRLHMVHVDGIPTFGQHYTSAGYLQLGDRFAEAIAAQPARCQ